MIRSRTLGALALLGAALVVGCGKKDDSGGGGTVDGKPIAGSRSPAEKREAVLRLKQIGIGLHNYHDANVYFPAGIVGKNGQLGLSWRVAILPQLEHESLYRQFKLDEPWDSPHNKKLIPMMPKLYESPGVSLSNGQTYLRAFAGPTGFIPGPYPLPKGAKGAPPSLWANQTPGTVARGRRITEIMDGTSNSIMVVEAADPVEWTRPDDLPAPPLPDGSVKQQFPPLPKLGPFSEGGFHALLCDGSTRFIRNTVKEDSLRAAITVNGGEVYSLDD